MDALMTTFVSQEVWDSAQSAGALAGSIFFIITLLNRIPDKTSKARWLGLFIGFAVAWLTVGVLPGTYWQIQATVFIVTLIAVTLVLGNNNLFSIFTERILVYCEKTSLYFRTQLFLIFAVLLVPVFYFLKYIIDRHAQAYN